MEVATADRVKPRRLPGVDGVWVAIGADSVIFAILFLSFMQARLKDPAVFEASRQTLNMHLGGIDTLILLTSSWSVALAIQAIKRDLVDRVPRFLLGGALTGLMFMVSKSIEYFQKFADGITPGHQRLLHVVLHADRNSPLARCVWHQPADLLVDQVPARHLQHLNRVVPECVASYWHLVDLLWVVMFPLLYLHEGGLMSVLRERVTMGVAGPDGVDLRDDVGSVQGSVQPHRRGGRDLPDRRGQGQVRHPGLHGATRCTDPGACRR